MKLIRILKVSKAYGIKSIKISNVSTAGQATLHVPASVAPGSTMTFYAIPWNADKPEIKVTNGSDIKYMYLDEGDNSENGNTCGFQQTIVNFNLFVPIDGTLSNETDTPVPGSSKFSMNVDPDDDILIESVSSDQDHFRFVLFGFHFIPNA